MKLDAAAMMVSADDACALLKALANPHQTLASQHLGMPRRDGVVAARRDGQSIYYGLQSGQARALIETLSRLFCPVPDRPPLKEPRPCSAPPRPET